MFYHLESRPLVGGKVTETLSIPVYTAGSIDPNTIEVGTLIVILAGFFWVAAKLWRGLWAQMSEFFRSPSSDSNKKKQ